MYNPDPVKRILISVMLLLIASCAPKVAVTDIQSVDPEEIVQRIELFENGIRSVKGLAKVRIETPQDKISYTQVTVAEEPDLLRLEALNPFGTTVGFISSDGKYIYIISSSERGRYDSGEEFDLSYVYPGLDLRITAESLVNLVLGRLPYRIYESDVNPELTADSGLIKLSFRNGESGGYDSIWVNSRNYRVEKAEFTVSGGKRATLSYIYFDGLVDGHYFPRVIDLDAGELSIKIVYEPDVELNEGIDSTLFKPSSDTASVEKKEYKIYN